MTVRTVKNYIFMDLTKREGEVHPEERQEIVYVSPSDVNNNHRERIENNDQPGSVEVESRTAGIMDGLKPMFVDIASATIIGVIIGFSVLAIGGTGAAATTAAVGAAALASAGSALRIPLPVRVVVPALMHISAARGGRGGIEPEGGTSIVVASVIAGAVLGGGGKLAAGTIAAATAASAIIGRIAWSMGF